MFGFVIFANLVKNSCKALTPFNQYEICQISDVSFLDYLKKGLFRFLFFSFLFLTPVIFKKICLNIFWRDTFNLVIPFYVWILIEHSTIIIWDLGSVFSKFLKSIFMPLNCVLRKTIYILMSRNIYFQL